MIQDKGPRKKDIKKRTIPPVKCLLKYQSEIFFLFVISLIAFIAFKKYLLLDHFFIFKDIASDSYNQDYPLYTHFYRYLWNEGIPKWTFSQGMGQNMFPAEINNPFVLMIYLSGPKLVPYVIGYIEFLKIIIGGLIFYFYLKTLGITKYCQFIGGVLFTFSGYMFIGSCWYWHTMIILSGAFLLFSFEKLLSRDQWLYFPIAIYLLSSRFFFYLIPFAFFMLIYSYVRYLETDDMKINDWLRLCLKMLLLGSLGAGISAFFSIHDIMRMLQSPRGSGEVAFLNQIKFSQIFQLSSIQQLITAIMRLFSNDIIGVGSHFSGWRNYLEAPTFYCGLFTLLILSQLFVFFDKRKREIYISFLFFWFIIICFPFFRYLFYLFAGDYYRGGISFFIPVSMIYVGMRILNEIDIKDHINKKLLTYSFLTLLILICTPMLIKDMHIQLSVAISVIFIIIIQFTLLYALGSKKNIPSQDKTEFWFTVKTHRWFHRIGNRSSMEGSNRIKRLVKLWNYFLNQTLKSSSKKEYIKAILAIIICIEAAIFSYITINHRQTLSLHEYRKKTGFNDHTIDAIRYIKNKDTGFFRIEKNYSSGTAQHLSVNDAQIQQYFGTRSYYSFNQKHYIQFLAELGLINPKNEAQTRWSSGLLGYPLLESIGAVKYHLNKTQVKEYFQYGYEKEKDFGDITILKNKYYLPLGTSYDTYMTESDFKKLSYHQRQYALFHAAIIKNKDLSFVKNLDVMPPFKVPKMPTIKDCLKNIDHLKKDPFQITSFKHSHIKGSLYVKNKNIVFFSIPYDKGWRAIVNGKKTPLIQCNIGFMGLVLKNGSYDIVLHFTPPLFFFGFFLSLTFLSTTSVIFVYRLRKYKRI